MDDIAEQQDVAKEISEAISNPVAFGQDVDEDELEKELEELEQEELEKHLIEVDPTKDNLPAVPQDEVARPSKASKFPYCFKCCRYLFTIKIFRKRERLG